jgi:restriction system protein
MSRGISGFLNVALREVARAERAKQREAARQHSTAVREMRNAVRQAKLGEKEAKREYLESRITEAQDLTQEIKERELRIAELLSSALKKESFALLPPLKTFWAARFDPPDEIVEPKPADFVAEPLGFFSKMLPGSTRRKEARLGASKNRFEQALGIYENEAKRRETVLQTFLQAKKEKKDEIDRHNAAVESLQKQLDDAEHSAVVATYQRLLEESLEPVPLSPWHKSKETVDAVAVEVGYAADSQHLVVDLELPDISVVPEDTVFRYTKATDQIISTPRSIAKRKALYSNLLCQIALKSIDTVFRTKPSGPVSCLTLNGMIDAIDPATGQQIRACLLSVRVTSDTFAKLVLEQVRPEECLRGLKASVSRAPDELVPVKPLVELDMFDPRFVGTTDVLSGLDDRPNLMDLSPSEFEGLITQLFGAMGLDTRQTRASRDGGVDCVAFDSRPIFGGKVVIQAKRYKNTVGVSAVRDLFGTVQNEGASKGILVTTSGYGKAAYFARGKPLELLDGANLLHLLSEHAKIDARIIMPDEWIDLPVHGD